VTSHGLLLHHWARANYLSLYHTYMVSNIALNTHFNRDILDEMEIFSKFRTRVTEITLTHEWLARVSLHHWCTLVRNTRVGMRVNSYINRSCPIVVLTTVLGRPRHADVNTTSASITHHSPSRNVVALVQPA
jgi:hypothetical protein